MYFCAALLVFASFEFLFRFPPAVVSYFSFRSSSGFTPLPKFSVLLRVSFVRFVLFRFFRLVRFFFPLATVGSGFHSSFIPFKLLICPGFFFRFVWPPFIGVYFGVLMFSCLFLLLVTIGVSCFSFLL